jgi:hypothetical protein
MKRVLLLLALIPFGAMSQIDYTVTVLRLKAKADNCDGGAITFCSSAPQDPVFHIWTTDAGANENHNCWIFDNDPEAEYNLWKDIQNLEIANETNVLTTYITIDMGGFESDELIGSMQCDDWNGDQVMTRQLAQQFDLSFIPADIPYITQVNIGDVYYAEIEILWTDPFAGINGLDPVQTYTLAPNPTQGVFHIHVADEHQQDYSVQVTDMYGRVITNIDAIKANEPIDLTGNESGTYFVTVEIDGRSSTRRIMLK